MVNKLKVIAGILVLVGLVAPGWTSAYEVGGGEITSPTPGSVISTGTITFDWGTECPVLEGLACVSPEAYQVGVGTTQESIASEPWGDISYINVAQNTSVTINGIPIDGNPIYVRLWTKVAGTWFYRDHIYSTKFYDVGGSEITSPTIGSKLNTSTTTFIWQDYESAESYWLGVGTTREAISSGNWGDIYSKPHVAAINSATVDNISLGGDTLYVRLWTKVAGTWFYRDYTYATEVYRVGGGVIISPVPGPGSILESSTVTFEWNANSTSPESYWLGVGTTRTSVSLGDWGDIYSKPHSSAITSVTIDNIPLDGNPIYVRLWTKLAGDWFYREYTYYTGTGGRVIPEDYGLTEGDIISSHNYNQDPDIFIVNDWGYKRLFLNPVIFSFYGHLRYNNVKSITPSVRDKFSTSGLFKNCEIGDERVFAVEILGEDSGKLHWLNMSGSEAIAEDPDFFNKVFCINNNEFNWYANNGFGTAYTSLSQIPSYSR